MKDSDVESLLRKYRPAGPPPELRQRIVATAREPLIWPWASAAAALLVLGFSLRIAAGNAAAGAHMNLQPSAVTRVTDDLTRMLGGDLRARELAGQILVQQQIDTDLASGVLESAGPTGGVQP